MTALAAPRLPYYVLLLHTPRCTDVQNIAIKQSARSQTPASIIINHPRRFPRPQALATLNARRTHSLKIIGNLRTIPTSHRVDDTNETGAGAHENCSHASIYHVASNTNLIFFLSTQFIRLEALPLGDLQGKACSPVSSLPLGTCLHHFYQAQGLAFELTVDLHRISST